MLADAAQHIANEFSDTELHHERIYHCPLQTYSDEESEDSAEESEYSDEQSEDSEAEDSDDESEESSEGACKESELFLFEQIQNNNSIDQD